MDGDEKDVAGKDEWKDVGGGRDARTKGEWPEVGAMLPDISKGDEVGGGRKSGEVSDLGWSSADL